MRAGLPNRWPLTDAAVPAVFLYLAYYALRVLAQVQPGAGTRRCGGGYGGATGSAGDWSFLLRQSRQGECCTQWDAQHACCRFTHTGIRGDVLADHRGSCGVMVPNSWPVSSPTHRCGYCREAAHRDGKPSSGRPGRCPGPSWGGLPGFRLMEADRSGLRSDAGRVSRVVQNRSAASASSQVMGCGTLGRRIGLSQARHVGKRKRPCRTRAVVLITGGTGMAGPAVARHLVSRYGVAGGAGQCAGEQ